MGAEQRAHPVALPRLSASLAGSVMPRNSSGMRASRAASLTAANAATVCISVSAVPTDFEIATKRVVASGSFASGGP
jgi:hypothetical protein